MDTVAKLDPLMRVVVKFLHTIKASLLGVLSRRRRVGVRLFGILGGQRKRYIRLVVRAFFPLLVALHDHATVTRRGIVQTFDVLLELGAIPTLLNLVPLKL
jgi:hypothetical protein